MRTPLDANENTHMKETAIVSTNRAKFADRSDNKHTDSVECYQI
jgi:hypothetical protein